MGVDVLHSGWTGKQIPMVRVHPVMKKQNKIDVWSPHDYQITQSIPTGIEFNYILPICFLLIDNDIVISHVWYICKPAHVLKVTLLVVHIME